MILQGRFNHILESFSPSLSSNLIPFGVCSTLIGLGRNLVGPNMSAIIDLSFVQHVLTPHFLNCKRCCEIWQCLRIQSSLGYFWYLESSLNFPTLFTAITGEPSRTFSFQTSAKTSAARLKFLISIRDADGEGGSERERVNLCDRKNVPRYLCILQLLQL